MGNDPESKIARSWDANADAWARVVRSGAIESRAAVTDHAVLAAVLEAGAATVLDVGCGEGWLCRALAAHGIRCTGIDGSAALIARAREGGAGEYLTLSYAAFAADPRQVKGPFDAVVFNFSLLGADIGAVLAAAARVLQPNGVLVLQTVHPLSQIDRGAAYEDGWRTEDFATFDVPFPSSMPWYFRTLGSWVRELRRAGYQLQACDEPTHPHTGMPASLLVVAEPGSSPGG